MAEQDQRELSADPEKYSLMSVLMMARKLRKEWKEPDQRIREWGLNDLRREFHRETDPSAEGPPPLTPFEQAIIYLERHWDRARFCGNVECPTPYFFAKTRKPQKYCGSKCAGPAKREAKRRWWNKRSRKKHTSAA